MNLNVQSTVLNNHNTMSLSDRKRPDEDDTDNSATIQRIADPWDAQFEAGCKLVCPLKPEKPLDDLTTGGEQPLDFLVYVAGDDKGRIEEEGQPGESVPDNNIPCCQGQLGESALDNNTPSAQDQAEVPSSHSPSGQETINTDTSRLRTDVQLAHNADAPELSERFPNFAGAVADRPIVPGLEFPNEGQSSYGNLETRNLTVPTGEEAVLPSIAATMDQRLEGSSSNIDRFILPGKMNNVAAITATSRINDDGSENQKLLAAADSSSGNGFVVDNEFARLLSEGQLDGLIQQMWPTEEDARLSNLAFDPLHGQLLRGIEHVPLPSPQDQAEVQTAQSNNIDDNEAFHQADENVVDEDERMDYSESCQAWLSWRLFGGILREPAPERSNRISTTVKVWMVQNVFINRLRVIARERIERIEKERREELIREEKVAEAERKAVVDANIPSIGVYLPEAALPQLEQVHHHLSDNLWITHGYLPTSEEREAARCLEVAIDIFGPGVMENEHSYDEMHIPPRLMTPPTSSYSVAMSQEDFDSALEEFDFNVPKCNALTHEEDGPRDIIMQDFELNPEVLIYGLRNADVEHYGGIDDFPPTKRVKLSPEDDTSKSPQAEYDVLNLETQEEVPTTPEAEEDDAPMDMETEDQTLDAYNFDPEARTGDEASLFPPNPREIGTDDKVPVIPSSPPEVSVPKSPIKRKATKNVFALVESQGVMVEGSKSAVRTISPAPHSEWSWGKTESPPRNRVLQPAGTKPTVTRPITKSGVSSDARVFDSSAAFGNKPGSKNKPNAELRQSRPLKSTYQPQKQNQQATSWGYPSNVAVAVPSPQTGPFSSITAPQFTRRDLNNSNGSLRCGQPVPSVRDHNHQDRLNHARDGSRVFNNFTLQGGNSQRGRGRGSYHQNQPSGRRPTRMPVNISMDDMSAASRRNVPADSPQMSASHARRTQTPTPVGHHVQSGSISPPEDLRNALPIKPNSKFPSSRSGVDLRPIKFSLTPSSKQSTREVVTATFKTSELRAAGARKFDDAVTAQQVFRGLITVAQFDNDCTTLKVSGPAGSNVRGLLKDLFPGVRLAASMN